MGQGLVERRDSKEVIGAVSGLGSVMFSDPALISFPSSSPRKLALVLSNPVTTDNRGPRDAILRLLVLTLSYCIRRVSVSHRPCDRMHIKTTILMRE